MSKMYIDNRVMVNGKKSKIFTDNAFNLQSYILTTIFGSATSTDVLSFTNGLTKSASNVVTLGGTLTANTTIAKGGFLFRINGAGQNQFITTLGNITSTVSTLNNSVNVSSADSVNLTSSVITASNTGSTSLVSTDTLIVAGLNLDAATGNVMSYTADGVTVARVSMVPDIGNATIGIKMTSCIPTYADEAAAGAAGLTTGSLYKTALGALMIKL
jgi:hypothetical protein